MPEQKLQIPQFATESEEAEWWTNNQDLLADEFERAGAERRLQIGSVVRQATAIRLDPDDIARAQALAAKRGLLYQTYLRMLVHDALEAEENKLAS